MEPVEQAVRDELSDERAGEAVAVLPRAGFDTAGCHRDRSGGAVTRDSRLAPAAAAA